MNRNQLLQKCLENLASMRAKAQNDAYINQVKAKANKEYLDLEAKEKSLIFEIGKAEAFGLKVKDKKSNLAILQKEKEKILNKLNISVKDLEPKYNCDKCKDTGYTEKGMCTCLKTMLNNSIIENSGYSIHNLHSFKDFNVDITDNEDHKKKLLQLKKKLESFLNNFPNEVPKTMVLLGTTGVGKTFITECFATELMNKGFIVSFISSFSMNNIFLSYHTANINDKNGILDSLLDPEVLVIDDLGTEPIIKNVTLEYFYLLLSNRAENNKPTIITTNLDLDQILARYHERIFSRLVNKRDGFLTKLEGTDLRTKK